MVDTQNSKYGFSSLNSPRYLEEPQTPLNELLDDVEEVRNENVLMQILNSPAPLDTDNI